MNARPRAPDATSEPEPPRRRVDLGARGTLVVRPIRVDDVDGLDALYESLSPADRYHRFFSWFRPPRRLLADWVRPEEHGGARLVAEVTGGADPPRIVAEAGYLPLESGNGELEITVAPGWRGWLGPYLLDALLETAAAHGVPNLEADVLLENRAMLAVVRARGFATVGHPDLAAVRVVIGTCGRRPVWPARHDRPRVLVEARSGRWRAEDEARAAGLAVVVCPGPDGGPGGRCPALEGERCPLAAEADAVVLALPPDDPRTATIAAAHRRLCPDVPVWTPERGAEPDELVTGLLALIGPRPR